MKTRNRSTTPIGIRLQRKLKRLDNGCLVWTGYVKPTGYAAISLGKAGTGQELIHRVAYELAKGKIPDGLVIDHLCGNRICANPEHLEAVAQIENVYRGKNPKLTYAQIHKIRYMYKIGNFSQGKLAKIFGVDQSNISRIVNNRQWAIR